MHGEGNGNALQCSCLENPRDRGAWWAAIYGVTQSWTQLKWLSSSSSSSSKDLGTRELAQDCQARRRWGLEFRVSDVFGQRDCYRSVAQSCLTLCNPMDCRIPGFPVLTISEFAQTHVHWVNDAIQPSHSLSPPSPAFSLSQNQDLFQGVGSLHQVAKVLELYHQSFQWIFRVDFL